MSFLIKLQQNLFFSYLNPTSYLKSYKTELILAFLPIKNSFFVLIINGSTILFSKDGKIKKWKHELRSYFMVSKELKKIKR